MHTGPDFLRPNCPYCGYALAGFERNACPECGKSLLGRSPSPIRVPPRLVTAGFWTLTIFGPAVITFSSVVLDHKNNGYPGTSVGLAIMQTGLYIAPVLVGWWALHRFRSMKAWQKIHPRHAPVTGLQRSGVCGVGPGCESPVDRPTLTAMIHPAPTSKIDPAIARGNLVSADSAQVVLSFPNTNYQLHLVPTTPVNLERGKRILGTIALQAKRIDTVGTGGEFIEPVYGRPRRVQGRVIRTQNGAVVIDAGVPIHATPTDPRQAVEKFEPGQLVSFDALPGATFTPTA